MPHSQNSDSITKPKSVPEFSAPQFPICLMGIITPTHFIETLVLQKHLDAMVTGNITLTHAPPCRLHYSAEMQTDQQSQASGNLLSRWIKDGQQHFANLSSAPNSVLQVSWCQHSLPRLFSPGKGPQPVPSHQDTSLNTASGLSSRSSPLLGPKSPTHRCKGACPQAAKGSHSSRTVRRC